MGTILYPGLNQMPLYRDSNNSGIITCFQYCRHSIIIFHLNRICSPWFAVGVLLQFIYRFRRSRKEWDHGNLSWRHCRSSFFLIVCLVGSLILTSLVTQELREIYSHHNLRSIRWYGWGRYVIIITKKRCLTPGLDFTR